LRHKKEGLTDIAAAAGGEGKKDAAMNSMREEVFERRIAEAAAGGTIFRKASVSSAKQRAVVGGGILSGVAKNVRKDKKRERRRAEACKDLLRVNRHEGAEDLVFNMLPYEENAVYFRGSRKHRPKLPNVEGTRKSPARAAKWIDVEGNPFMDVPPATAAGVLLICGTEELAMLLPRHVVVNAKMVTETGTLDDVFAALEALEKGAATSTCRNDPCCERVVAVDGPKSKYVNVGTKRAKFGAGLTTSTAALKQKQNGCHYEAFSSWIRRLEHGVSVYLPLWLRDVVAGISGEGISLVDGTISKIWPAMVAGRNVFLNVHTDRDLVWCLTTVVAQGAVTEGDDVICYFCFPSLKMAIPLKNGDMLLFNPNVPHCVSSRCDGERDAFCVSFYFDPSVPSGNTNAHALSCQEEEVSQQVMRHLSQ